MDLDTAAEELYGLAPGLFTARRDSLASEAREEGDREVSKDIKALRKPSVSAFLVNLLVREEGDTLDGLLDLGAALREAQEGLAGDELRELSQQRRKVVDALVRRAGRLGRSEGQAVTTTTLGEVQATLEAGLADPDAAVAIRAGRLTSALHYAGLGTDDAGSGAAEGRAAPARSGSASVARPDRAKSDAEIAAASKALNAASAALQEHERSVQEATRQVEDLRKQIAELQGRLDDLRADEAHAADRLRTAEREHAEAARKARHAEQELKRLRLRR